MTLISRKETASEYDKINNCAIIRPSPFVTIEGQLLSVRTVINMLHFLNQLIVYTIRKLGFSKLTKITPLTCSPFYQYNVRDLSVKGGTSERCHRTRREWTDEQRYAIISRYFDGRIKMKGPYPEITNINGQIIFQNFHQFKAFVGLSDCRIIATAPFFVSFQFY